MAKLHDAAKLGCNNNGFRLRTEFLETSVLGNLFVSGFQPLFFHLVSLFPTPFPMPSPFCAYPKMQMKVTKRPPLMSKEAINEILDD